MISRGRKSWWMPFTIAFRNQFRKKSGTPGLRSGPVSFFNAVRQGEIKCSSFAFTLALGPDPWRFLQASGQRQAEPLPRFVALPALDTLIPTKSLEILSEPPHLTVGRPVESFLKSAKFSQRENDRVQRIFVTQPFRDQNPNALLSTVVRSILRRRIIYEKGKADWCSYYIFAVFVFVTAITNVIAVEPGKISRTAIYTTILS